MKKKALVLLNGKINLKNKFYKNFNYPDYDIYCADGGSNYAYALHIIPKLILGDLDSISEIAKTYYEKKGVEFKFFSTDKNFTDGELILEYIEKKYESVLIFGGLGGSSDHFLTNINLICKYNNIIYENENEQIFWIKKNMLIKNRIHKIISLIPLSKIIELTLIGFKFNIKKTNILQASSTCMSNIILSSNAQIKYEKGSLIAVFKKNSNIR